MNAAMNPVVQPCSFLRRLGVIFYDLLSLFSVLLLFTAFVVGFGAGGAAIDSGNWVYQGFLLGICGMYYVWHWTQGRRTLGMRAWKVVIRGADGRPPSYLQCLWRFALSVLLCLPFGVGLFSGDGIGNAYRVLLCLPFGVGLFWAVFDRENRSLYDRLSRTRLMREVPAKST